MTAAKGHTPVLVCDNPEVHAAHKACAGRTEARPDFSRSLSPKVPARRVVSGQAYTDMVRVAEERLAVMNKLRAQRDNFAALLREAREHCYLTDGGTSGDTDKLEFIKRVDAALAAAGGAK